MSTIQRHIKDKEGKGSLKPGIDFSDCLPIKQARTEYFDDKPSTHSIRRWGVVGLGNPKVKLAMFRMGGIWFIRRQDAEEFKQAIQDPELYRRTKKSERVASARKKLAKAGC